MKRLIQAVIGMKIWKEKHGQDLIEYALMAGFVAVAAGALMPTAHRRPGPRRRAAYRA